MFNSQLKAAWAEYAYNKCCAEHGELGTSAKGAFSNYLARLFKREALQHISQDNFLPNLHFIREEIDLDITQNQSSTARVAEFISLALDDVLKRETLVAPEITTQTPQAPSGRALK